MKIGIIEISDRLINDLKNGQELEMFKMLYSIFFPIAIKHDEFRRLYVAVGYCDQFENIELKEMEQYPKYTATITTNKDKSIIIQFKSEKKLIPDIDIATYNIPHVSKEQRANAKEGK